MARGDVPRSAGNASPRRLKGGDAPGGAAEDVVDHRLDDRLGAVAKQELQDVEVGAAEAHRLAECLKPPRGPVEARPPRLRILLAESRLEAEQFPLGHPLFGVRVRLAQAGSPPPGAERHAVVPVGYPARELRRLPVLVVETRGGVGEVEGDEAFFMGGQHFSLPVNVMESYGRAGLQFWRSTLSTLTLQRAYGTDASDPVVCLNAAPAPPGPARGAPPVSRRRPRSRVRILPLSPKCRGLVESLQGDRGGRIPASHKEEGGRRYTGCGSIGRRRATTAARRRAPPGGSWGGRRRRRRGAAAAGLGAVCGSCRHNPVRGRRESASSFDGRATSLHPAGMITKDSLGPFQAGDGGLPPYLAGRESEQEICGAFPESAPQRPAAAPRDRLPWSAG